MEILVFVIFTLAFVGIIGITIMMFSPNLRTKLLKREFRATKSMLEDLQGELTEMGTTVGTVSANIQKGILDQNEDALREGERKRASIEKEGIEIKTRAIKDGLTKNIMYCKHCGAAIDEDSKFCKACGKKQ